MPPYGLPQRLGHIEYISGNSCRLGSKTFLESRITSWDGLRAVHRVAARGAKLQEPTACPRYRAFDAAVQHRVRLPMAISQRPLHGSAPAAEVSPPSGPVHDLTEAERGCTAPCGLTSFPSLIKELGRAQHQACQSLHETSKIACISCAENLLQLLHCAYLLEDPYLLSSPYQAP